MRIQSTAAVGKQQEPTVCVSICFAAPRLPEDLEYKFNKMMNQLACKHLALALLAVWVAPLLTVPSARAGGGAENVFLLVNPQSEDSLTVANYFIDLRKLPASNVFYVGWKPDAPEASGEKFRDSILLPTLQEIGKRGLGNQIDYLVYSCDFPWRLRFAKSFPDQQFPPHLRPIVSLTGATYLSQFVEANRKEMLNLKTNFYAMAPMLGMTVSRGFRSSYYWAPSGKRVHNGKQGLSYRLSTMLGVTFGRGSKVEEIVRYLRQSKEADGTHPDGTVYFMKNGTNPRSTVRHDSFPDAVAELRVLGVKAEILNGIFPQKKTDVIGVTTGTAHFNIRASGSRLLPGAIGDNLTSFGAVFNFPKKKKSDTPNAKPRTPQTLLTEFLHHGAAGASGTVIEPYAIQAKFPFPSLHVHYARGCSMAEAFYQSVTGPFQLLVVGDPLCQPWAVIPKVEVEGISDGQKISGQIKIAPTATSAGSTKIRRFELFVDGVRTQLCQEGEEFDLDTTALADGFHDLRVVAVDDTPIETQGRWLGHVTVKNGRDALQLSLRPAKRISISSKLTITATSTTTDTIAIMHNGRVLGHIRDGQGRLRVAAGDLGKGPVTIYAKTDASPGLRSQPVRIMVF